MLPIEGGDSILGDIQDPPGHGPEKPALADSAQSKGTGLDLQSFLSDSTSL